VRTASGGALDPQPPCAGDRQVALRIWSCGHFALPSSDWSRSYSALNIRPAPGKSRFAVRLCEWWEYDHIFFLTTAPQRIPSIQLILFPKLIGFFLCQNSHSFHCHSVKSHVLQHKPCHREVHSACSSCTAPEGVRKRTSDLTCVTCQI